MEDSDKLPFASGTPFGVIEEAPDGRVQAVESRAGMAGPELQVPLSLCCSSRRYLYLISCQAKGWFPPFQFQCVCVCGRLQLTDIGMDVPMDVWLDMTYCTRSGTVPHAFD